jgi:hypothetical protein
MCEAMGAPRKWVTERETQRRCRDKSMNEFAMHGHNVTVHASDAAVLERKTGGTPSAPVDGR